MCESTRQGLRQLVEIIALPYDQREEEVYSKQKVYDFFTVERIKELGNCCCKQPGCCFHATQANPPKIFTDEIVSQIREDFTSALGLLVSFGEHFGTLIFEFIEKGFNDKRLAKEPLTMAELAQLLSNASNRPTEDLAFDARKFHIREHEFFLPQLSYKSPHISIGTARSLPFSVGEEIGRGAYSIVYEATMLPGYHDFPNIKHGRIALKTYRDWNKGNEDCNRERENNERWDAHSYIMPLQASLDHRKIFMAIYPLAKQDLRKLLQEDPPPEYSSDPKKAWKQFMNLLSALDHIHSSKPEYYGYHFDIKPHNILVRFNGDWVITDLGLAHSKANDTGISETSRREGNERYRAPEARPHRTYDVWAMGCIGCEIIAWFNEGAQGVENFRKSREQTHDGCTLDNFHHNQKLKEPVTRLLDQVKNEDGFSGEVAKILRKMLEIDPAQRLKTSAAKELFEKVLGITRRESIPRRKSVQSPQHVLSVHIPSGSSARRNSLLPTSLDPFVDNLLSGSENTENINPNLPQIQVTSEPDDLFPIDPEKTIKKLWSPVRMPRKDFVAKRALPESPIASEDNSTLLGGESILHKRLKTIDNTRI